MTGNIKLLLAACLLIAPLGCATLPEPRADDLERASARWPGVSLEDLQRGKKIYIAHCASCHALHLPDEFTASEWEKALVKMQWKAKINDGNRDLILAYVTSFSKDKAK